jgi:hypothetical protein
MRQRVAAREALESPTVADANPVAKGEGDRGPFKAPPLFDGLRTVPHSLGRGILDAAEGSDGVKRRPCGRRVLEVVSFSVRAVCEPDSKWL